MSGINQNNIDLEVLKALADDVRLEILEILRKEEMNVTDITKRCSLSRPAISHHLQILKRAKILESRKEGKEIYYSVNMQTLRSLSQSLLVFISTGKFQ